GTSSAGPWKHSPARLLISISTPSPPVARSISRSIFDTCRVGTPSNFEFTVCSSMVRMVPTTHMPTSLSIQTRIHPVSQRSRCVQRLPQVGEMSTRSLLVLGPDDAVAHAEHADCDDEGLVTV